MATKSVEDRCLTFYVFLLFGTGLFSNRSKAAHKSTILKHSEGCKLFNARTVRLDFRDTDSTSETADAPQTAGFACPSATRRPFRPLQHRPHCCHSTHRQGNHRLWVHPYRPPRLGDHPRCPCLLDCLTCKPTGRWSSRPSGSKPRTCWTPVGAASTNTCTATASNPAQLNALARPHTPAKAKTQPTKNPPQQAKTTKKPPRSPHTTNEPWSLHDQGSHKTIVAVAAGFEPAVAINHTAFRVLHLRPLGHATVDYRSGITPHSATRQPVGRDTSPGCASIVEPMPGSARPKHAPSRRAAHSPHAADVVPAFRVSPSRRRPACAEPSRLRDFQRFPHPAAPRVRRTIPQADRHERPLKRRPRLKAPPTSPNALADSGIRPVATNISSSKRDSAPVSSYTHTCTSY